jgi:hypothetical protein
MIQSLAKVLIHLICSIKHRALLLAATRYTAYSQALAFLVLTAVLGSIELGRPASGRQPREVMPLPHAHAHNDYLHKRPLLDALDQGFCSVEADVFLENGALLVGHFAWQLRPERTLEKLYLDPLRARVQANAGHVYPGGPKFWLLVDVKTEARSTYAVLDKLLARYADMLSVVKDGKFEEKAVTVVISGNRASTDIAAQKTRFAGIDGRATDLESTVPAHLMPWISERWSSHFRWRGDGVMPLEQQDTLKEFVKKAHRHGRLVRFWDTPETTTCWQALREAGVDLINTDQLARLQQYFSGGASPAR